MTDPNKRLPALALVAMLLLVGTPVLSGGRDVPDHIAEGSSNSETGQIEGVCSPDAVTQVTVSGLSLDVITAPDGTVTMQPTLFSQAGQFLRQILSPEGGPEDSCPER